MKNDDLLVEVLAWCDEHPDGAEERGIPQRAFRDILNRGRALTEKQAAWVRGVHEKLFDRPTYENLVSTGRVAPGAELATPIPEVLKRPLPLKPPGYRKTT